MKYPSVLRILFQNANKATQECPCGYFNHPDKECICGNNTVQRYLSRISGPLLDRIDLHIEVTPVQFEELSARQTAESSSVIRGRVMQTRALQKQRFESLQDIHCNAQMSTKLTREICKVDEPGKKLLKTAISRLNLSARAYDRILKVARTIADMEGSPQIENHHLAEAIQYRSLDRETWGGRF